MGEASWTPRKQFTSGGARGGALATEAERVRVEHIKEKGVGSTPAGQRDPPLSGIKWGLASAGSGPWRRIGSGAGQRL